MHNLFFLFPLSQQLQQDKAAGNVPLLHEISIMPADLSTSVSSRELTGKSFVSNGKGHGKHQLLRRHQLWYLTYVAFISAALCYLLFSYKPPEFSLTNVDPQAKSSADQCAGRYIYVHNISSRFNTDLVQPSDCHELCVMYDMCEFVGNDGLGPPFNGSDGIFGDTGWYGTDQFTLEMIFHGRMKQYQCLTNDSSMATAIYVPYYVGLDVGRYLWGFNSSVRDALSQEFLRWLRDTPEWKVMSGRDHFMVAGRTTWDLRRPSESEDWGSDFMNLPETKKMTVLIIESSHKHSNDFAIPYPTYFHPTKDSEVFEWQDRMRKQMRRWLFSFAGGATRGPLRGRIIDQCVNSTACKFLLIGTSPQSKDRYTPESVMNVFESSVFCLQPPGDTPTRRSIFDSMITGCIPVFFTPASAYTQYSWHLPRNYTKYSVLISEYDLREGKVEIEEVLRKFSEQEVREMREEVIGTIPNLIFKRPESSEYYGIKDAFDLSVEGVLERVGKIRRLVKEGLPAPAIEDGDNWKRALGWTGGEHEWDRYF